MTYVDPDLISDETAAAEAVLAGTADRLNQALDLPAEEGWDPAEGHVETATSEAMGVVLATLATVVKSEARDAYSGFGQRVLDLPRDAAQVASALTRWTLTEPVPEGTEIVIPDGSEVVTNALDGTPIAFATVGDAVLEAPDIAAEDVRVVALDPGPLANGLTGFGRDFETLPFIASVEFTTMTTGGRFQEPIDEYVTRLARRTKRRLRALPITYEDYADTATDHPQVDRCLAINLLDASNWPYPVTEDDENRGGHITLVPLGPGAVSPAGQVFDELAEMMRPGDRPLNVSLHFMGPQITELAFEVKVRLEDDADEDAATAAAEAAIRARYDRETYGVDEDWPGRWRLRSTDRVIHHYDVAHLADGAAGVAGVVECTINDDLTVELEGYAPLPEVVSCNITVVS